MFKALAEDGTFNRTYLELKHDLMLFFLLYQEAFNRTYLELKHATPEPPKDGHGF